ncbi:MAG TPA: response regulator [Candidatus Binatia bacterium]|nr:response regulator [Candidatus Binatia bacterium]
MPVGVAIAPPMPRSQSRCSAGVDNTMNATTLAFTGDRQTTDAPVILLVEDELRVREVTRDVLEDAGYRVLASDTPKHALQLVARHEGAIDLLLTDVVMPGMNGAELARRLRVTNPGLITMFMSGYTDSNIVKQIRKTSAIHLQKPFTISILLSRVAEALMSVRS